jgi:hypothetical protein
MNIILLKTLFWTGFVTYLSLALIYLNYIRIDFINKNLTKKSYCSLIFVTGTIILCIHSIELALHSNESDDHNKTIDIVHKDYLTDYPANIGFGLIFLYFCLIFGKSNHYFYLFAPLGYMFLATNNTIGLYPVILFHLISIGFHIYDFTNTDYIMLTVKVIMLFYFNIYAYADITKRLEENNIKLI